MGGSWIKCPFCDELFELDDELNEHIKYEHLKLSEKPKKEYLCQIELIIKAKNREEAERILELISQHIEQLPKPLNKRILSISYTDETGETLIDEVSNVDWKH